MRGGAYRDPARCKRGVGRVSFWVLTYPVPSTSIQPLLPQGSGQQVDPEGGGRKAVSPEGSLVIHRLSTRCVERAVLVSRRGVESPDRRGPTLAGGMTKAGPRTIGGTHAVRQARLWQARDARPIVG